MVCYVAIDKQQCAKSRHTPEVTQGWGLSVYYLEKVLLSFALNLRLGYIPEEARNEKPLESPWLTKHLHLWSVRPEGVMARAQAPLLFPVDVCFQASRASHMGLGLPPEHGREQDCLVCWAHSWIFKINSRL